MSNELEGPRGLRESRLEAAPVPAHPFAGQHLLAELYGVPAAKLDDSGLLEAALRKGIEQSGATLLNLEARRFSPHGVTVLALLSESHASLHSYPEAGALFFDAFTCGPCDPEAILGAVVTALEPQRCERRLLQRGG